jgi:hypothetical protein
LDQQNLVANILSLTLFSVALLITTRAFYLCFQNMQGHNYRLFILGMAMGIIVLTALASFAGDNIANLPLNVNWFKYTAQSVAFLFVCLSLVSNSPRYLYRLMLWHIAISILLFVLLTPLLPTSFPDPPVTKMILGGSRAVICFVIFFFYVGAFMRKETRFSLLMSGSFLLLFTGYLLNMPKYLDTHLVLLDNIGDGVRITGLIILLIAIFL